MEDYNTKASLEGAVNLNEELPIRVMIIKDTFAANSFLQHLKGRKLFRGRLIVGLLAVGYASSGVAVNDLALLAAFRKQSHLMLLQRFNDTGIV